MDDASHTLNILMIEDNRGDFVLARTMLAETESDVAYEIVWADTLEAGLAAMSGTIDAVLLDLTLPDSTGWPTFEKARKHRPDIPIILLTGLSDESLGMRAVHAGAQDYLVKGQIDGRLLSRTILYAVERKRTSAQLAEYARQLHIRNEQLRDDINMAREVQQALLPRQYPVFPADVTPAESQLQFAHAYRPCATVGGDFFTVSQLSNTRASVLICDVMGHGMRGALITALLRGVIEELMPHANTPGRFLTELNRGLATILNPSGTLIFASALYAVLDIEAATIAHSSAGHAHPVIITTGQPAARTLRPAQWEQDCAMGISSDTTYKTTTAGFKPGDRLLFFTDGICEPESPDKQTYGDSRLLQTTSAQAPLPLAGWLDAIIADASRFCGLDEFDDDVCLVGVEFLKGRIQ